MHGTENVMLLQRITPGQGPLGNMNLIGGFLPKPVTMELK